MESLSQDIIQLKEASQTPTEVQDIDAVLRCPPKHDNKTLFCKYLVL